MVRAAPLTLLAALSAGFLCGDLAAQAALDAKTLARIKRGTVYLEVGSRARGASGTGWVLEVDRKLGRAVLVTNSHVIALARQGRPLQATFHRDGGARRVEAVLVAEDAERDLAIVYATLPSEELPEPLELAAESGLRETLGIYAVGFPFGESLRMGAAELEATITPGRISNLHRDAATGDLTRIQLDADVNPGNSGGPVVDESGDVAGVAVSTVLLTDVSNAIPTSQVRQLREQGIGVILGGEGVRRDGGVRVAIRARLMADKRKGDALIWAWRSELATLPQRERSGAWARLAKDAAEVALESAGPEQVIAHLQVEREGELVVQLVTTRKGNRCYGPPYYLVAQHKLPASYDVVPALPVTEPVVEGGSDDGDPGVAQPVDEDDWLGQAAAEKGHSRAEEANFARPLNRGISSNRRQEGGLYVTDLTLPEGSQEVAQAQPWGSGDWFILTASHHLHAVELFLNSRERAVAAFPAQPQGLGANKHGVVLSMPHKGRNSMFLLSHETLETLVSHELPRGLVHPSADGVYNHPDSETLQLLSLPSGRVAWSLPLPEVPERGQGFGAPVGGAPLPLPGSSTDIFFDSRGALHHLKAEGGALTYVEAGVVLKGRAEPPIFSPDGKYVALRDPAGEPPPDHEALKLSGYRIYKVDDLQKPITSFPAVSFDRLLAFLPAAHMLVASTDRETTLALLSPTGELVGTIALGAPDDKIRAAYAYGNTVLIAKSRSLHWGWRL